MAVGKYPHDVHTPELGRIEISRNGLDHAVQSVRGGVDKLQILGATVELLENALVTQIQGNKTGEPDVAAVYVLETPVTLGSNSYVARHIIKRRLDGNFYYDTQSVQIKTAKSSESGTGQTTRSTPEQNGFNGLTVISVKKFLKFVKAKDKPLPGGPTNRDRIRQVLRFLRDELPDDAGAKDAVQELAKRVSKLKDTDTTALDEEKARLKGLLQERLSGLRLVRDSTKGQIRQIEARAKDAIAQGTVGAAYTWKAYQNKVAYYSRLAAEATARGAYAEAAEMKQRELYHAYLAKHAVAAREQIEKDKRKLADNLKRITRKDAPIRYMALLRELDGEAEPRRLHDGELPESPTMAELLAKPPVKIVHVTTPEGLEPSDALVAAQEARDKAYNAGKRKKDLPDNPYWSEYRTKVKKWLFANIPATCNHIELGNIQIDRGTLDHAVNSVRGEGIEKLAVLTSLVPALENSLITQVNTVTHGDSGKRKVFIAFSLTYVGSTPYLARHVIKEGDGGRYYYDTQSTQIKIADVPSVSSAVIANDANDTEVISNFSTIRVEDLLKFVKAKDKPLPGGPTNRDRIRQVLRFLRDELPDDAGAKDAVQELAKRVSKLKDTDTTALDEEKARLKGLLQERLSGLRLVRDSTKGQIRQIEARAKDAIAQGTVGAAYTWKAYQNKVAYYSRLAAEATARGAYAEAAEMKQRELYHAYLAKHAVAAREQIEKDKRKLADNLKRITRKDAPIRYMALLRELDGETEPRCLHDGELPESPTMAELLAKPDVNIVHVTTPEGLEPRPELVAAQKARDEAYNAGKRKKDLPDNPYWSGYRKKAKEWLLKNVPKKAINRDLGSVEIERSGIDHAVMSVTGDGPRRLQLLSELSSLLSEAIVTQVQRPKAGDHDSVKIYILYSWAVINDAEYLVRHVVKERKDGAYYYDTQGTQIKTATGSVASRGLATPNLESTDRNGFSTIRVEDLLKFVKAKDKPLPGGPTNRDRIRQVFIKEGRGGEFYYDTQSTQIKIADASSVSPDGQPTGANDTKTISNLSTISVEELLKFVKAKDKPLPGGPTNRDRIRQVLRFLRDELPDDAGAKDAVQELAKRVSKLKDTDTTALDEEKARLKGLLQERLSGLRLVRDSTKGQIRQIEARAKDAIAQGTVGAAYTWKAYQNKVAYYSRLAAEATARGAYAEAAEMKQRELYHAYLAKHAVAAREQIEKDKRKLADNLKRITRKDAPIIMDVQSRYFIEHLMYRLGLTQTDAVMPADGFELAAVARLLDVDAEFGMAGSEVIPDSVRQLLAGGRRDENAWRHISVSEWEEVAETLTVVYKVGRRAQEGVTIKDAQGKNVAIADAATELAKDLAGRFGRDERDLRRIEQERTLVDKVVHTGAGLLAELIKPEVILNRLDGRAGSRGAGLFHRYIYLPIEQAMNKKRELEAQGKKNLHAIFERRYSASELREMRTKRKYAVGERERYTKEEILCAALNWGTKQNRQRTCFTFGVGERDMLQVFEDVLDSRDWDTVEAVWALLDSYFDERSRINERERGVPIAKVEPLAFSVGGKRRTLLPESPTREDLLAKPDVQVVDVVVPQEVKKFKKSFKDFRTAVKNWLINRTKGSYLNRELGDIQLATNGIKHAVSSAYDTDKQAILLMLPQIIEHGVVTSVEKNKSNDANIRKVFFLYTPVRYAGKSYLVKSVVKEMSDGKRYYDARTTEIKTADGWSAQPLLSKQPRERIPKSVSGSSTVSVAELLKYVNEIEGVRVLKGGYYPIVYDPQLSVRASDLEVAQELTRQMSSNAVFGSGLSATKKRQAVVHRELFLSLDVIPRAMNEAILHISMREAVLDVAHLLDHENLAEPLQKVIGVSQYRVLRQWVRDCWREDTDIAKGLEMYAETLRRNSVFAVMAYRASTAALNICNFPMAMWEIGPVRFLRALLKFYLHPQRTARAIKAKSSFLAEREENLDRDLARGMRIAGKETTVAGVTLPVGAAVDVKAQIDRFGYYAITKTDLMLSLPAWQARYEDTVRELIDAGETDVERIEREAVSRADEAVRRVWGSGETKDMARVQKGRIMKYFTPFYTFFSTVLNAHIEAGYALKDRGDVRPLISTVFAWIIVQAAMETLLRMAIDEATGRGDDDDFFDRFMKEYTQNAVGTLVGGLPIVRDAVNGLTMQLTGEYFPSRGSQVVALRIVEDMADFTAAVASDKKDWIDVGRSGARVMNRLTGFSDTLSDGIFTFIRFALTDTEATWDEAVAAMVFDRKLKKGK